MVGTSRVPAATATGATAAAPRGWELGLEDVLEGPLADASPPATADSATRARGFESRWVDPAEQYVNPDPEIGAAPIDLNGWAVPIERCRRPAGGAGLWPPAEQYTERAAER